MFNFEPTRNNMYLFFAQKNPFWLIKLYLFWFPLSTIMAFWLETCAANFFAVRKNCEGKLVGQYRLTEIAHVFCAQVLSILDEKYARLLPGIFLIKWIRPSDHFGGQATAVRSHGVNWSIDQEGSPLPSARSVFRSVPQGQHEENVTFEKVTKLPSGRVLGTANFSPF